MSQFGIEFFLRRMLEVDIKNRIHNDEGTQCQRHIAQAAIYASKLARRKIIKEIESEESSNES